MSTPRITLPEIAASQGGKYLTHNEALQIIDAFLMGVVLKQLGTPPVSYSNGQCWIIGPSASGIWAGKDNQIAQYYNSAWYYYTPTEGFRLYNAELKAEMIYTGSYWVITPRVQRIRDTTSTSFTLAVSDADCYIRINTSSATSVGIPNDTTANLPIGSLVTLVQVGTAYVTVSEESGVTVLGADTKRTRKQGSVVHLLKVAANTWDIYGDFNP